MAKKKSKQVFVDELTNEFRNTKNNEVFNVEMSTTPQTVKSGKGKDTVYLKGVHSLDELTFTKNGRNLEITRVVNGEEQKVILEKYFTSTTGKATKSSIKNIKVDVANTLGNLDDPVTRDYNIITESLIEYEGDFKRAKSGLIKGTVFNDKILGSSKADKIKANSGDDIIYGAGGNDKMYGGKGADTFVFDTYSRENPITGEIEYFGAGADKIYDATNVDTLQFTMSSVYDLNFSRSKNNLVVKYYDTNDEGKTTKENTVTIVNYYKKKQVNRLTKIVALNKWGTLQEYSTDVLFDENNPEFGLTAETDPTTKGQTEYMAAQKKASDDAEAISNYAITKSNLETLERNVSNLYKTVERTENEGTFAQLQASVTTLIENYTNASTTLSDLNSDLAELNAQIEEETDKYTLDNLKTKIQAITGAKESAETALSNLNDKVKELNQLINANTTSFDAEALRTKIQELQAELETANNTLDENAEAIANYSTLVTTVANINKQIDADTTELGADDLITKVSGLQNSISDLTVDKENLTDELSTMTSQFNSAATELSGIKTKINELNTELNEPSDDVNILVTNIGTLQATIADLNQDKSDLQTELNGVNAQLESLNNEIINLNKLIDEETDETTVADLRTKIIGLQGQITTLSGQKSSLESQLAQKTSALETAETNLQTKTTEYNNLVQSVKELNQLIDPETTAFGIDDLDTKIQGLQTSITDLTTQLGETSDALTTLKNQVKDLNIAIDSETTGYTITDLQTKVTGLQSQLAAANTTIAELQALAGVLHKIPFGVDTEATYLNTWELTNADKLVFEKSSFENATFIVDNYNLIIRFTNEVDNNGEVGELRLIEYFDHSGGAVMPIQFVDKDGITHCLDDLSGYVTELSAGHYTYHGSDKTDVFMVSDETYGNYNDAEIYSSEGVDTIKFETEKTLTYDKSENDLYISWDDHYNCIRLRDYFTQGVDHSVKTIQNGDKLINIAEDMVLSCDINSSESKVATEGLKENFVYTPSSSSSGYPELINATNEDKITIKGAYMSDVRIENSGDDLIIYTPSGQYGEGKSLGDTSSYIKIKDYYTSNNKIDTLVFEEYKSSGGYGYGLSQYGDNGTLKLSDMKVSHFLGGSTSSTVYGTSDLSEDFVVYCSDGSNNNYTVSQISSEDSIILYNAYKDDIYSTKNYDDLIIHIPSSSSSSYNYGNSYETTVTINDYFNTYQGNPVVDDLILKVDPQSSYNGEPRGENATMKISDIPIRILPNSSYMYGDSYYNVAEEFYFDFYKNGMSSSNTEYRLCNASADDIIVLKGVYTDDVYVQPDPNNSDNLIIKVTPGLSTSSGTSYLYTTTIIVENYFNESNSYEKIENLVFIPYEDSYSNKTVGSNETLNISKMTFKWIGQDDMTIDSNDSITEEFVFNLNEVGRATGGTTYTTTINNATSKDKIVLKGANADDVYITKDDNNLIIHAKFADDKSNADNEYQITVAGYYSSSNTDKINKIELEQYIDNSNSGYYGSSEPTVYGEEETLKISNMPVRYDFSNTNTSFNATPNVKEEYVLNAVDYNMSTTDFTISGATSEDKIILKNVKADEMYLTVNGSDLIINTTTSPYEMGGKNNRKITLSNYFSYSSSDSPISNIVLEPVYNSYNDTWSGDEGTVKISNLSYKQVSKSDNDQFYATMTYNHNREDIEESFVFDVSGDDNMKGGTIYMATSEDKIVLRGVRADDVYITKGENPDDLIVHYKDSGSYENTICISNYFMDLEYGSPLDKIVLESFYNEFSKTTIGEDGLLSISSMPIRYYGTSSNDNFSAVTGKREMFIFDYSSTQGSDTITGISSEDTLKLTGVDFDNVYRTRAGDDMVISYLSSGGRQSVTLDGYYTSSDTINQIIMENGNTSQTKSLYNLPQYLSSEITGNHSNFAYATDMPDTFGIGNDYSYATNNIIYGADSDDTIRIYSDSDQELDIKRGKYGNDLILYSNSGNNRMVIKDYYTTTDSASKIDNLVYQNSEGTMDYSISDIVSNNNNIYSNRVNGNTIIDSVASIVTDIYNFDHVYTMNPVYGSIIEITFKGENHNDLIICNADTHGSPYVPQVIRKSDIDNYLSYKTIEGLCYIQTDLYIRDLTIYCDEDNDGVNDYKTTLADIMAVKDDIANWLSTETDYMFIGDLIDNESPNSALVNTLVAKYNSLNWTQC